MRFRSFAGAETDHNDVNLVSGKSTIEPPSLLVPRATNLRYDRVRNAAPFEELNCDYSIVSK